MFDVAIIGGSFAGLTAALQFGRASRSVVVIDAGRPRNRTSPAAHGVAGWDGVAPADILARFRADLAAYATVQAISSSVMSVKGASDQFALGLANGEIIEARRIILAHGVQDILPEMPGLADAWGDRVLHCPYCHGYEVKGEPLAVLASHPMSAHQAMMLRADWSNEVTLITGGAGGFDTEALAAAGVRIETRALVRAMSGAKSLTLGLAGGGELNVAALFVAPRASLVGSPAEMLCCSTSEGPMGPFVRVGAMAQTSVPGVFAAGDVCRPAPNINFALGDGAQAGTGCHASLLFPPFVPALEVFP